MTITEEQAKQRVKDAVRSACRSKIIKDVDSDFLYEDLLVTYTNPNRAYHNLVHIAKSLDWLDRAEEAGVLCAKNNLTFAILFHDYIHEEDRDGLGRKDARDPRIPIIGDESASAAYARKVLLSMKDFEKHELQSISSAIHATGAANKKYMKALGLHVESDCRLIYDIDRAILGASRAEFEQYEWGIRQEYGRRISSKSYLEGRIRFLKRLDDDIYYTLFFSNLLSGAAKDNVQFLIHRLEEELANER